jgi:hypothetical protein
MLAMLEKTPDRRPTLPVVEARLAELREELAPLGDTGPSGLRALESRDAPQKPEAQPTPTDSVLPVLRGPPKVLIASTVFLLAVAVTAVVLKLRQRAPEPAPTAIAAPAAEPPAAQPAAPAIPPAPPPIVQPATLVVHVNAPDARIELDGRVLAAAAHEGRFAVERAGAHELVVSAPHRRPFHQTVTLAAGGEMDLPVMLERVLPAAATRPAPVHKAAATRGDHDYMIDPFAKTKR